MASLLPLTSLSASGEGPKASSPQNCIPFDLSREQPLFPESGSAVNTVDGYIRLSADRSHALLVTPNEVFSVDGKTHQRLSLPIKDAVLSRVSPDGKAVTLIDLKKNQMILWDTGKNRQQRFPLLQKTRLVGNHTGKNSVFQAFDDGRIAEFRQGQSKPAYLKAPKPGKYSSIRFSDDGRFIEYTREPTGALVLDRASGKVSPIASGGEFIGSSSLLIRGDRGTYEISDLARNRNVRVDLQDRPFARSLSKDGRFLALTSSSESILVDLTTGTSRKLDRGAGSPEGGPAFASHFSSDGRSVITPQADRIQFTDVQTGRTRTFALPGTISRNPGEAPHVAFSPDGKKAAALLNVSGSQRLAMIDLDTGKTSLGAPSPGLDPAFEFFGNDHHLLFQKGLRLVEYEPNPGCVREQAKVEVSFAPTDGQSCPVPPASLINAESARPLAQMIDQTIQTLCQSPYNAKDWADLTRLPSSGDIPAETAKNILLELQKPGAFDPERHLPALLSILNSPLAKQEPDLVLNALAPIAGAAPAVYDQLLRLHPELDRLVPQGDAVCRTAAEQAQVQVGLDNYIRSANGADATLRKTALRAVGQQASSNSTNHSVFVTVGSENKAHQTKEWDQKTCTLLYQNLQLANGKPTDTTCASRDLDPNISVTRDEARRSGAFPMHVSLLEKKDGSILIDAQDWKSASPGEKPIANRWHLSLLDPAVIRKITRDTVEYDSKRRDFQESALAYGIKLSKRLSYDGKTGRFKDAQPSPHPVTIEEAYKTFENESADQKHYLRAMSEIGLIMGVGALKYYTVDLKDNQYDWDFKNVGASLRAKEFGVRGWRFDDNAPKINIHAHSFTGALYYTSCRTNNLSQWESMVCAFAASLGWESGPEFHEVTSLNDMTVTPVDGIVLGEAWYQHGRFFNRGAKRGLNKYLSYVIGGPERFHDWLDHRKPKEAENVDKFGFPTDIWHQFDLSAGYGSSRAIGKKSEGNVHLGLETQILNQPNYDQEGTAHEVLNETAYSKFLVDANTGLRGLSDFHFLAKDVFGGYYAQDIKKDENDQLDGYSVLIGPASQMDYISRFEKGAKTMNGPMTDMIATVEVLGGSVDLTAHKNGFRVGLSAETYADFALVRNQSLEDYIKDNGRDGLKSVIALHDYYYAVGASGSVKGSLAYKAFELSAEFKKQYLQNVSGGDRFKESVTRNPSMTDEVNRAKLSATYKVTDNVLVRATAERFERKSKMDKYGTTKKTDRLTGDLIFRF